MSKTTDGGQAFPCQEFDEDGTPAEFHEGLSALDWFAGQALAGLLSVPPSQRSDNGIVADAYKYAAMMVRHREVRRTKIKE